MAMLSSHREIEPYLPHSGPMALIDRILERGAEHIVAEVDVGPRLPCWLDGRIPAYIGIELMAQAVAAWSGLGAADPSRPPPIGYLLGTRSFQSARDCFEEGLCLRITARQKLDFDRLAIFACEIGLVDARDQVEKAATAEISVYLEPESSIPDQ